MGFNEETFACGSDGQIKEWVGKVSHWWVESSTSTFESYVVSSGHRLVTKERVSFLPLVCFELGAEAGPRHSAQLSSFNLFS